VSTREWERFYTEPNIRFSALWENYMVKWGIVLQFQHLAQVGFPSKADYLSGYLRESLDKAKPGGEFEGIIVDTGTFFSDENIERVTKEYALEYINNALAVSSAACLVFGHSLLDALLNEYLDMIVDLDSSVFHWYIKDQNVACSAIIDGKHNEALNAKVRKHVGKLKRESIVVRAETLHQVCRPPSNFFASGLWQYDPDRLRSIDRLRHDIIHTPRPDAPEVNLNIQDDLVFMVWLGMYFVALMNHRFDLKILPLPPRK